MEEMAFLGCYGQGDYGTLLNSQLIMFVNATSNY